MTTTNLGELTYTRIYHGSPELLFDCMTTPEHLTHFWGPTGMTTPLETITVELRPGGRFETVMVNDESGERYPTKAVYVTLDRPNTISFTEPDVEGGMLTTITFRDLGDGRTEATTHQTNVPEMFRSAEAQAGMQTSFDRFDAYLAELAAG
jgi:uncharacterized protein YndB with AHSA1/START domain